MHFLFYYVFVLVFQFISTKKAVVKPANTTILTTTTKITATTPQAQCLSLRNHYYNSATGQCQTCPNPAGNKKFAIFWESFVDGCDNFLASPASKYVTHVYWTFAIIGKTGSVGSSLQGSDQTLTNCIQFFRQNCIKSLISLGGANNRDGFLNLKTPQNLANFQKSVVELINKYTLDGIDIDDETSNSLVRGSWLTYSNKYVLDYINAIRKAYQQITLQPTESELILTWSEFPYSAIPEKAVCDQNNADWRRCYNDKITPLVDFVNVMAYNYGALSEFDKAVNFELPQHWATRIPAAKLLVGICRGKTTEQGACAFGATPTPAQQVAYAKAGSTQYGGAFLWTGSGDWTASKGSVVQLMGQGGGFAHG